MTVNFIIQELKFCKIARVLCVSVPLIIGNFEVSRENLEGLYVHYTHLKILIRKKQTFFILQTVSIPQIFSRNHNCYKTDLALQFPNENLENSSL